MLELSLYLNSVIFPAFVPQYRDKLYQTNDRGLLNKLIDEGRVTLTPSREVDNQRINSYDDTFILDYAALHGGVVVTRDNYRTGFVVVFSQMI